MLGSKPRASSRGRNCPCGQASFSTHKPRPTSRHASTLRRIPFPFTGDMADNSLEIFHVSHGKWETAAPIRTFVPYEGGRSILASYTCTPVVHFSLDELTSGSQAKGRTVAELGAMNQPIDMVSFNQDGGEHLLISNSSHGLIKIACRDIDEQEALSGRMHAL